jgi:aspartate racemase
MMPTQIDQGLVMAAIRDVKAGRHLEQVRRMLDGVCAGLRIGGAKAVVLGCTELPLVFAGQEACLPIINPTRILAEAAVKWALEDRR